jgi:hypothetical protein
MHNFFLKNFKKIFLLVLFFLLSVFIFICIYSVEKYLEIIIISLPFDGEFSPVGIRVQAIPCEDIFKLLPQLIGKANICIGPIPIDSTLGVTYVIGDKTFLNPDCYGFFFNLFLNGVSSEPKCYKIISPFLEAVNNCTK